MDCLYRVTSNEKGVFSALKEYFGQEEWHKFLLSDLSSWLPNPGEEIYEQNDCISLFTEEGFRKFNEIMVPVIGKLIPIIVQVVPNTNENLLYSDMYQKVFDRGD